jgi:Amt family ammonium transporter
MKYITAAGIAIILAIGSLSAQDTASAPEKTADLEGFIKRSDANQSTLIENSTEILQRLGGIEKTLGGEKESTPAPASANNTALEKRLVELEAKLAAAPAAAPAPAEGVAETVAKKLQDNMNMIWIIVTGAMVFFMKAGFCMLELGLTRAKNAINICMKNFLDFPVAAIAFLFVGFGLMFGKSYNGWFGQGPFWISDIPGDNGLWSFWFFQLVFCGTAATIISGALAERTKFMGYLIYIAILCAVIYPIAGHWAWGSLGGAFGFGGEPGWLEARGFKDFAGSTVVHCIGGASSLAGILVVGARIGRFKSDGTPVLIAGHNLPLATLGTFILWFGWYGFNPGSTLTAGAEIGRIAVNTTIAPCSGAIIAMLVMWLFQGRPDIGIALNGALGGLVAITANCNVVTPASAVLIGMVAGLIATFAALLLERLRLDDPVGAVPVHLSNGLWGTLSESLFNEAGFNIDTFYIQTLGTVSITVFVFICAFIVFKLIDLVMGLRVSDADQEMGLDFSEHSGAAYPDFVTTDQGTVR